MPGNYGSMTDAQMPTSDLDPATARVHSAEISAHDFPRARKGLDPAAVKAWLKLVEASFANLEEELGHERTQREQLLASVRRTRRQPASAGVRSALMQSQLRRRAGGYDRGEVEKLLQSAAAELARLENETALLNAELEAVRSAPISPSLADTIMRLERDVATLQTAGDRPRLRQIALP